MRVDRRPTLRFAGAAMCSDVIAPVILTQHAQRSVAQTPRVPPHVRVDAVGAAFVTESVAAYLHPPSALPPPPLPFPLPAVVAATPTPLSSPVPCRLPSVELLPLPRSPPPRLPVVATTRFGNALSSPFGSSTAADHVLCDAAYAGPATESDNVANRESCTVIATDLDSETDIETDIETDSETYTERYRNAETVASMEAAAADVADVADATDAADAADATDATDATDAASVEPVVSVASAGIATADEGTMPPPRAVDVADTDLSSVAVAVSVASRAKVAARVAFDRSMGDIPGSVMSRIEWFRLSSLPPCPPRPPRSSPLVSLVRDPVALDAVPVPITCDWPRTVCVDELPIHATRAESASPNPHVNARETTTAMVTVAAAAVATATAEGLHLARNKGASGYRHVYKRRSNKYLSLIERNGKQHTLGYFNVAEEAALCAARWLRDNPSSGKSNPRTAASGGLPLLSRHALCSAGALPVLDDDDDLDALVRDDVGEEARSSAIGSLHLVTEMGTAEASDAATECSECPDVTNLAPMNIKLSTLISFFVNQVRACS